MRNVLWMMIFLFLGSCQNKKSDVQYFENGSVKLKGNLLKGKRHGAYFFYYQSGKLESKAEYNEGLQDGLLEEYYANGKLKSRSFWKNDKANGLAEEFYSNGQLKKRVVKKDDKNVGEIVIYNQKGIPVERRIHNENGDVIYVGGFDSTGVLTTSLPIPVFNDLKDTFNLNEPYTTEVSFGLKLSGSLKMIIGKLNKAQEVVDTLAVLKPNKDGKFKYRSSIQKPGRNVFSIKFIHSPNKADSLSVDGLSTNHVYYVKRTRE